MEEKRGPCLGRRSSFPPPPGARRPTVTRCWSRLRTPLERIGIGPSPACTARSSLHRAPLALARSASADMLSVPRRVHANKIHAALSALFCRIFCRCASVGRPVAHAHAARVASARENGKPRPIKKRGALALGLRHTASE